MNKSVLVFGGYPQSHEMTSGTLSIFCKNREQLPLSFEDLIPENHLVRVVEFLDGCLERHYNKGTEEGTVNYHCDVLEAKYLSKLLYAVDG